MSAPKYVITERSSNAKTGPIPVTTSSRETCPSACPFKGNGCYAEAGPLARIWNRLTATNAGERFPNGVSGSIAVRGLADLVEMIRRFPGMLWRHNQAGDLHGVDKFTICGATLRAIVKANKAVKARGFTYTHYPVLGSAPFAVKNRKAIEHANKNGFTVNLSGNSLAHADKLAALSIAPVVSVVPDSVTADTVTPAGRRVVICPATVRENVDCMRCGMCQVAARDFIIAFPAHGTSKRKASEVAA